jgi:hypothetical protein
MLTKLWRRSNVSIFASTRYFSEFRGVFEGSQRTDAEKPNCSTELVIEY